MRTIIFTLFISFSALFSAQSQENKKITLTVNITGLTSSNGTLLLGLYNQKDTFLKVQFKSAFVAIANNKAKHTFKNLPKGTYAVSFVHDENNNKKMDTNFFGIPKEAYGCSNNARGYMGPPAYDDAKFFLGESKEINIAI
ncbi:DUF2141 domain-containing protein [uncultured Polaribacter sp.]|uniref:DUF2141 domain-containing protein n=1 Tax=uncultured Polaribacter sp. TaxID=174711 RepID=UPI000A3E235A|nr:hypothetical protein [Polaribacter sp.]|tara:strand:- start:4294 stop:4716 length:423 start_codon:yes stop_codon:yes gene_type:complete